MTSRPIPLVLFAEDDPDDRMLAEDALAESGIEAECRFAVDGQALLDLLRGEDAIRPDLIFLDLNMPRKDGREALKELKADELLRDIPVVILSTSKAPEDVQQAYDLGVAGFVTKPPSFEGLVDTMRRIGRYWFDTTERTRE